MRIRGICLLFAIGFLELLVFLGAQIGMIQSFDLGISNAIYLLLYRLMTSGMGIGLMAGCFYYELEKCEELQDTIRMTFLSVTLLFCNILACGIRTNMILSMSFCLRMSAYFVFPIIIIFLLDKMGQREDVGGHLQYYWLIVATNLIYISLFQKAGPMLLGYTIFYTIVELLLVYWMFDEERSTQLMLGFSFMISNFIIYSWYQGKVNFLIEHPVMGAWKLELTFQKVLLILMMLLCSAMIGKQLKKWEPWKQMFFLAPLAGLIWETFLMLGANGWFHMEAEWQTDQGIWLMTPFIAVYAAEGFMSYQRKEKERKVARDEKRKLRRFRFRRHHFKK